MQRQSVLRVTASFGGIILLGFAFGSALHSRILAAQSSTAGEAPIPVRYTESRESAKITFRQDATQTEEKYYLETVGTGVAWIDFDQDGLMDLYFVQSAATDFYKPPHPIRSSLLSQQRRWNLHGCY